MASGCEVESGVGAQTECDAKQPKELIGCDVVLLTGAMNLTGNVKLLGGGLVAMGCDLAFGILPDARGTGAVHEAPGRLARHAATLACSLAISSSTVGSGRGCPE